MGGSFRRAEFFLLIPRRSALFLNLHDPHAMPVLRIFLLLLFHAASTLAFAQSDPRAIQEEDKYFRPILIITPESPKKEVSDVLPVEIRISGSVNATGSLEAPVFSPIEGNEKYINAIKDVLNLWRFRPAIDSKSCMPIASNGVLSVWFEEKNGSPSVSVSTPKRQPVIGKADAKPRPLPRVYLNRPRPEYPQSARRAGMEGYTELLFSANHEGEVVQTTVLYSIPNKIFGDAAIAGSRRVKFSAGSPEDDSQKSVCILVPFKYCLTSNVTYPYSACR